MCICLSEVIFMEGFMRKIYSFINGLEVLHLIGKWETIYFLQLHTCHNMLDGKRVPRHASNGNKRVWLFH